MKDKKNFFLDIFDIGDFPITAVSGILLIFFYFHIIIVLKTTNVGNVYNFYFPFNVNLGESI